MEFLYKLCRHVQYGNCSTLPNTNLKVIRLDNLSIHQYVAVLLLKVPKVLQLYFVFSACGGIRTATRKPVLTAHFPVLLLA